MAVTLDFTGLYYELDVPFDQLGTSPSVRALTEFAVGKQGQTGGKLIFAEFSSKGFLSAAYVEHRATPQSRQKDSSGNPSPSLPLPTGIYGFDDEFRTNVVEGVQISFSLAWQYYIFRAGQLINGSSGTSTERTIVSATDSGGVTPLEDGDIVRWRLVAIGGLPGLLSFQMAQLGSEQKMDVMSSILTEKLTVRESVRAAAAALE